MVVPSLEKAVDMLRGGSVEAPMGSTGDNRPLRCYLDQAFELMNLTAIGGFPLSNVPETAFSREWVPSPMYFALRCISLRAVNLSRQLSVDRSA